MVIGPGVCMFTFMHVLDENVNAWSPVDGTVWEGLGGVALVMELCP